MYFRSILSGTLAIFLMSVASGHAYERAGLANAPKSETGISLAKFGLPKIFGGKEQPAGDMQGSVQLAQAGDPRISALEEQVRSLSGTIEELNFQILQMQEQLRKIQEDNEFRFQELEQKKTDAGVPGDSNVASAPTTPATPADPAAGNDAEANGAPMEPDILVDNGTGEPAGAPRASGSGEALGSPPTDFGTITFDENGNVKGGDISDGATQADQSNVRQAAPAPQPDDTRVAALPTTDSADELYRNSYEFILSGDYGTAEEGFRDHISRYPGDQKAADAHFWLGEALLGQKKYRDAAEVFLAANKDYPSAKKAPDMLLKLGVSLVGLDQRDVACATFSEIGKRYKDISGVLKDRIKQEQALAAC